MYRYNRGVAQNDAQAVTWFRKAVGDVDAEEALRRMEINGSCLSKQRR